MSTYWLVTIGEPLPLPGSTDRLLRTGLLAETLTKRGHEVVWWTSTVNHFQKKFFTEEETSVSTPAGRIQFLHGGSLYRESISFRRMLNHYRLGQRFREMSHRSRRPAAIVCSMPTIELSLEAVRFGKKFDIPVVLDVRDLWPDVFMDAAPFGLKTAARLILQPLFTATRQALGGADAIFATSADYLRWGMMKAGRSANGYDRVFPLGNRRTPWTPADKASLLKRLRYTDLSKPVVTFAGTFGRSYDLDTVILAARPMQEFNFVLCGEGEKGQRYKTLAQNAGNIDLPGWLSAAELTCLLDHSMIGLAAYTLNAPQSMPNKIIEYLSAGLPVLSTLTGEARSFLADNGCGAYYPAGGIGVFGQILRQCLPRLPEMAQAARSAYARHFEASSVYAAMADHVEVISCQPPGR